jgi:hypothetical protein
MLLLAMATMNSGLPTLPIRPYPSQLTTRTGPMTGGTVSTSAAELADLCPLADHFRWIRQRPVRLQDASRPSPAFGPVLRRVTRMCKT